MPQLIANASRYSYRPGIDRRKARRVAVNLSCDLRIRRFGLSCETVNLSVGGALLRHTKPPEAGERRRFSLKIPGSIIPLVCEAEILSSRETDPTTFAVRFLDLSARDWIRVASFMREHD